LEIDLHLSSSSLVLTLLDGSFEQNHGPEDDEGERTPASDELAGLLPRSFFNPVENLIRKEPEENRSGENEARKNEVSKQVEPPANDVEAREDERKGRERDGIEESHRKTLGKTCSKPFRTASRRDHAHGVSQPSPSENDEKKTGTQLTNGAVVIQPLRDSIETEKNAEGNDGIGRRHSEGGHDPGEPIGFDILSQAHQADWTNRRGVQDADDQCLPD